MLKASLYLYNLFSYSRVLPDKVALIDAALDTASLIASKSPVAVQGTKISMVYSRDHSVQEGLEHIVSISHVRIEFNSF